MESQPQNPEFRINPENFHPWFNTKLMNLLIYLSRYIQWNIPSLLFQTRRNNPLVHIGLIPN